MHITFPPAGQSRREENKQPKGEYTMETLRIGLVGTGAALAGLYAVYSGMLSR